MTISPRSSRLRRAVVAAIWLAAPGAAFGQATVQSRWRDRPILVDGGDADWASQPGDAAGAFKVAFANDKRDLFILLRPSSAETRARLAGGDVVLWLDATGTGVKRLGLRLRAAAPGRTQADRVPDLVGPAASVAAAAVTRNDPYAARMGEAGAGVLEARVPLALFGAPAPRQFAVGIESAEPIDAPAGEQTAGAGASAGPTRGNWQGADSDGDHDGDGDRDGGPRGGNWRGGSDAQGRVDDGAGGSGNGRYAGRHGGGGRGASLPVAETGSSAVWLRLTLARPAPAR